MRAATECGIPATDDFNRGDNHGVGYFDVSQRDGWRLNAHQAFVEPVQAARPNLVQTTVACVDQLEFDHGASSQSSQASGSGSDSTVPQCTGIVYLDSSGSRVLARATSEVILAAGSVGSVQILERSGVGDAARLGALGISARRHLPGVGANLQDHLQLRPVYKVTGARTLNTRANSLMGAAAIGLEYLLRRSGPMSMAPSQLGAFARSSADHERPNVQFHVQPLSLDSFGNPLHTYDGDSFCLSTLGRYH
jgi:choline dehydrogenase